MCIRDSIFTQAPRETFTTLLSLPTAQRSVTCAAMTLRSDMFWSSSQRPFRQAGSSTRQGKGRRQSIGMAFCQDLDRIEIESKTHTPSCNYWPSHPDLYLGHSRTHYGQSQLLFYPCTDEKELLSWYNRLCQCCEEEWWWLFPCMQGFGGKVWWIILNLHLLLLYFLLSGDQLAHTNSTLETTVGRVFPDEFAFGLFSLILW